MGTRQRHGLVTQGDGSFVKHKGKTQGDGSFVLFFYLAKHKFR